MKKDSAGNLFFYMEHEEEGFYESIKEDIGFDIEKLVENYIKENILKKPEFQGRIFYIKARDYFNGKRKISKGEKEIVKSIANVDTINKKDDYFKELFFKALKRGWYKKIPYRYKNSNLIGYIGRFINEEFFRVKIFGSEYKNIIKKYLRKK